MIGIRDNFVQCSIPFKSAEDTCKAAIAFISAVTNLASAHYKLWPNNCFTVYKEALSATEIDIIRQEVQRACGTRYYVGDELSKPILANNGVSDNHISFYVYFL